MSQPKFSLEFTREELNVLLDCVLEPNETIMFECLVEKNRLGRRLFDLVYEQDLIFKTRSFSKVEEEVI